jgi:hypothetical protein
MVESAWTSIQGGQFALDLGQCDVSHYSPPQCSISCLELVMRTLVPKREFIGRDLTGEMHIRMRDASSNTH